MILPTRRWRVFYFRETVCVFKFERSTDQSRESRVPRNGRKSGYCRFLELSCTIKEVQFTAGQNRILMSLRCVLPSRRISTVLGLLQRFPCQETFCDAAQNALRSAYDNDTTYGFKVIFPSGNGLLMSKVRQHTWSVGNQRCCCCHIFPALKGKPSLTTEPLKLLSDLKSTTGFCQ